MRIGWPSFSLTRLPTIRATTSTPPPGANGTSRRIGRVGYCDWACADQVATHAANAAARIRPARVRRRLWPATRIFAVQDRIPAAVRDDLVGDVAAPADRRHPAGLAALGLELVDGEAGAKGLARLHRL